MDYTSAIQPNQISTYSTTDTKSTSGSSSSLSTDTFYQLLAAQLQYQDPMESMDTTQMVLQMAQFATLEAMNNLNDQFGVFMEMSTIQDGAALVGKEVKVAVDDDTTMVGTVDSVGFTSNGSIVKVNGEYFPVWNIIEVGSTGSLQSNVVPEIDEDSAEV